MLAVSVDAAATVAQIIPVLLLVYALETTVNPRLMGRQRLLPALVLSISLLLPVVTEIALVNAVLNGEPLSDRWAEAAGASVLIGLGLVVMQPLLTAWGLMPEQRTARK